MSTQKIIATVSIKTIAYELFRLCPMSRYSKDTKSAGEAWEKLSQNHKQAWYQLAVRALNEADIMTQQLNGDI